MSDPGKAVFLSYASQDAEAAKRICDALRAAGVEVWFDQSELVGGDAWDAKIRKQIGSCALFIPIISANTQARAEGYFRLEWRLADKRTELMGKAKTFLLPICIDDTKDAEADVPDSFSAVQWTRLKGGEVSPAFVARVQKILSGEQGAGSKEQGNVGAALRRDSPEASRDKPAPTKSRPRWLVPAAIAVVTLAAAWLARQPGSPPSASILPPPPAVASSAAKLTPARELVAKAWVLLNKTSLAREELGAADDLCRRAADLDPNDAEVWAAWSQVDSWYVYHRLERTAARQDGARTKAARALNLAPGSYEARLAHACYLVREGGGHHVLYDLDEAEKTLQTLLRENPDEPRALEALGVLFRNTKKVTEYRDAFERMAKTTALAAKAYTELGWAEFFNRHNREAEAAADAAIRLQPYYGNLNLKAEILARWWGDLAQAQATLDRLPASNRLEDYAISSQLEIKYAQRDSDAMLRVLDRFSRDWIESNAYDGPKAWWSGLAHRLAGRDEAGRLQWRTALKSVERRLSDQPDSSFLLRWRARLLAATGQPAEGEAVLRLTREMGYQDWFSFEAIDETLLGRLDAAVAILEQRVEAREHMLTAASLRLGPDFDPLRSHPRFQALLARLEADPRYSPKATPSPAAAVPAAAKSVAVLAFANLSDDKANEYFSDGISEELLNVLAKIPGLKVSARTSAFYFKGKEVPIPEIARQLGVAYVVEGSVRKQGNQVRITAQLIKAADGFHVWSDTFTRDLKDIFAVQDEIAGLIAKNLELKMGFGQAAPRESVSPEAYQAYLLGRAAVAKAGMTDLREAVVHFERAVQLERKYAAAWVQLASAHTQLGRWGGAPTLQSWAAARAAIDRALALEPDSPDVLLALGWIRRTAEWDWRGAELAFRRSLQLRPNHPDALAGAAVLLFNIGQTEEAFRLGQQAARLDPLNAATQIDLSIMFYLNHNWREAEQSARRALQLAPRGGSYRSILGWSLTAQGRYDEAEAEIARDNNESEQAQALGSLAIARGQYPVARKWLARLEEIALTHGDNSDVQMNIAWLSVGLGDKDRAFAALERARASRDPSLSWLRNSWYLDGLHADPRWPAFLKKVGLADEQLK